MNHPQCPLISVVIPSYNQGRFLRGALSSILSQDYENVEVIVVDGGSSDETVSILTEYSAAIAWWVSEPDEGQADAIQKGFAHAAGDVLAWLNCDDAYLPGAFRRVAREFAASPGIGMVYGDYYLLRESGDLVFKPKVSFDYRSALYAYMPIAQPSSFMAREAYFGVGGVDPSFRLAMDFDLFLRIGRNYAMRHVRQPLAVFRVHPSSKSVAEKGGFKHENQRAREKALGRPWRWIDDVTVRPQLARTLMRFLVERHILVTRRDKSKA